MNQLFRKYSPFDTAWMRVLLDRHLHRKFAPFPAYADARDSRFTMPDCVRVALFSDWATGEPETRAVAEQIEAAQPHQIIYLGNVFRSGLRSEARQHFLAPFPKPAALQRRWALNGNHDMIAGGWGYFAEVLPTFAQPASYFTISNSCWRLIGLDTAYRDRELEPPQLEWLKEETRGTQRNILLTHHPPLSAFEPAADKLLARLRPLLDDGRVHAWFWGWEHRHVIYQPSTLGTRGRCIGHGGLPYLVTSPSAPLPASVQFENRRTFDQRYGVHGFALLEFDGPRCEVRYIDEDGTVSFAEKWD